MKEKSKIIRDEECEIVIFFVPLRPDLFSA